MKENKEKDVTGEESCLEIQSEVCSSTGDKRNSLPKSLDLGNIPS